MHGAKHAGDELVDAVALLHQGHQGRDPALIVLTTPEMGKDEFLESLNLVLEVHQVGNGLVALVGVVDGLQADVLLVLKGAVELGVVAVERQLGNQVVDVFRDQGAVAAQTLANAGDAPRQRLDPSDVCLGFLEGDGVAFLENLVDGDEGLEGLDFISHDGLPGDPVLAACPAVGTRRRCCARCLTLSCRPRRTGTSGDPMCTQCSCAHVSLSIRQFHRLFGLPGLRWLRRTFWGCLVWEGALAWGVGMRIGRYRYQCLWLCGC